MKPTILILSLASLLIATGCHAHGNHKKVVVVKKPHTHKKVILVDDHHRRSDYRIVYVKPKKGTVCRKHKKHWHCH